MIAYDPKTIIHQINFQMFHVQRNETADSWACESVKSGIVMVQRLGQRLSPISPRCRSLSFDLPETVPVRGKS